MKITSMNWDDFKRFYPHHSTLLLAEYHGFVMCPASMTFDVLENSAFLIRASSPDLPDPWLWIVSLGIWVS